MAALSISRSQIQHHLARAGHLPQGGQHEGSSWKLVGAARCLLSALWPSWQPRRAWAGSGDRRQQQPCAATGQDPGAAPRCGGQGCLAQGTRCQAPGDMPGAGAMRRGPAEASLLPERVARNEALQLPEPHCPCAVVCQLCVPIAMNATIWCATWTS